MDFSFEVMAVENDFVVRGAFSLMQDGEEGLPPRVRRLVVPRNIERQGPHVTRPGFMLAKLHFQGVSGRLDQACN